MATLQYLKNKIANDLHRTDLTSEISDAIDAAIKHYERERLWFLEGSNTFTTSASLAWYAVPTDLKKLDTMLVTISGSKVRMTSRAYSEIDEKDSGNYTGTPDEYAIYANQFRVYPTPNDAYVMTLSYHKSLAAPSASGSNAWTGTGFELIRSRARWDVELNHLKDREGAAFSKQVENDAYDSLTTESTKKICAGKLRKSGW